MLSCRLLGGLQGSSSAPTRQPCPSRPTGGRRSRGRGPRPRGAWRSLQSPPSPIGWHAYGQIPFLSVPRVSWALRFCVPRLWNREELPA